MDERDLIVKAQHALASPAPENVAERLILFRPLLQLLEEVLVLKHRTEDQRRCLQEAVYDFALIMAQIREALDDWNLGLALTKELVARLHRLEQCLTELQTILLADVNTPSAMMAHNTPTEGQEP